MGLETEQNKVWHTPDEDLSLRSVLSSIVKEDGRFFTLLIGSLLIPILPLIAILRERAQSGGLSPVLPDTTPQSTEPLIHHRPSLVRA